MSDRAGPNCFRYERHDGVLQIRARSTRWLSTGWDGGTTTATAAYNVTVPEGFDRTDLDGYATARREAAGFEATGPVLFTGVSQRHARGGRAGSVEAVATVGLSNPASLPMPDRPIGETDPSGSRRDGVDGVRPGGTVNVVLGTGHALDDGARASLLATAVEAKTATLLRETGFTGTTTDAVVVGSTPVGPEAGFAGAATDLGRSARAAVRAAVRASLRSRYREDSIPPSVQAARHGAVTDRRADVFRPE